MNRPLDSEYLLEAILLLAEEDFGDAEVLKEQVKLLIRNHWDLLNKDTEIAAARKILEDLAEDLEQDEDAPRIHPQEQLELFDGPNEWAGGDRAGFEREQAAWLAIADGLGNLGYELNSAEDTRGWVMRNLL